MINWNYDDPLSRLRIPIAVAYGSNIKKVRLALLEAVKSHPDVLLTPRPQVWFQEFADSSLNFEIYFSNGCVQDKASEMRSPQISRLYGLKYVFQLSLTSLDTSRYSERIFW